MGHAGRRGVQALEFALAAPLLLLLGAGVVDYSWYLSIQHRLVGVTQEAIRAGMDADLDIDPAGLAKSRGEDALVEAGLEHLEAEVGTELVGEAPDLMLHVSISAEFEHLVGVLPVPETVGHDLTARLTYQ